MEYSLYSNFRHLVWLLLIVERSGTGEVLRESLLGIRVHPLPLPKRIARGMVLASYHLAQERVLVGQTTVHGPDAPRDSE